MKYVKQSLQRGIFLVACAMVFGFSDSSMAYAALLSDSECQSQGGVCETNNPTCTDKKRIDSCAFVNGQVRTCCGKSDASEESENKDVQCAKIHKGKCFHQNQTKDICTVSGMELKGECESENGVEMICCFDSKNPNNAYSSNTTSSGSAALNYTPLENLPGFEGQSGDFATYFKNLYLLALWIVGISALFMLVVGGFLYLSSAGNTHLLGTAKKTIYAALIGLIIALISWLLLDTINSDLTNLKLSGLSGMSGTGGGASTSSPVAGSAGKVLEEAYKMVALSEQNKCEYSQQTPRNGCDQSKSYPHTDCSDFTVSAYKRAGCSAPPDGTSNMVGVAEAIGDKSSLKPGDAIVYNNGSQGHVVICENSGCSTYTAAASTKADLVKGRDSGHMFQEPGLKVLRVSKYCKDS